MHKFNMKCFIAVVQSLGLICFERIKLEGTGNEIKINAKLTDCG